MDTEAQVQALTERILVSALISLGGVHAADDSLPRDPAETAFKLFAIARRVADEVAEDPSLLDTRMLTEAQPVAARVPPTSERLRAVSDPLGPMASSRVARAPTRRRD